MKDIISKIAQRPDIKNRPPVLLDIGASKYINPLWKNIAAFSIAITFDGDDRDFTYIEKTEEGFKKMFVFNRIVVEKANTPVQNFFLTQSPYCSSTLQPNHKALKPYVFAKAFTVEKTVQLPCTDMTSILAEIKLDYIDWFKTDTQGTDLRLFASLQDSVMKNVVLAEFEPGLIDAYEGEDKVFHLLTYMQGRPFFLTDFDVKGTQRMNGQAFEGIFKSKFAQKVARHTLKPVPGWAEITYMNNFESTHFTARDFIIGWLFNSLRKHHGVALMIAEQGISRFNDPFFNDLKQYSKKRLFRESINIKNLFKAYIRW